MAAIRTTTPSGSAAIAREVGARQEGRAPTRSARDGTQVERRLTLVEAPKAHGPRLAHGAERQLVVFRIVGYNRALETLPSGLLNALLERAAHVVSRELSDLGHVAASPGPGLIVSLLTATREEIDAATERVCMLLRRRVTLPQGLSGKYVWEHQTLGLSGDLANGKALAATADSEYSRSAA